MPIYMKLDGIEGQVTSKGFEKQVQLHSMQLGTNRHVATSTSHSASRETSAPNVSEIVITKDQDAASIKLFDASLHGEGKKCILSVTKTSQDGKSEQAYLIVTLENTLVSSYSMSGHGDGSQRPMESLSLNFTKIELKYLESDDKNKAAKPQIATWNLAAGIK